MASAAKVGCVKTKHRARPAKGTSEQRRTRRKKPVKKSRKARQMIRAATTEVQPLQVGLITPEQVKQMTGFSEQTIRRWPRNGKMPKPVIANGKIVRFRRADIEEWIAAGCKPVTKGTKAG